jgi:hypothetical protein
MMYWTYGAKMAICSFSTNMLPRWGKSAAVLYRKAKFVNYCNVYDSKLDKLQIC